MQDRYSCSIDSIESGQDKKLRVHVTDDSWQTYEEAEAILQHMIPVLRYCGRCGQSVTPVAPVHINASRGANAGQPYRVYSADIIHGDVADIIHGDAADIGVRRGTCDSAR